MSNRDEALQILNDEHRFLSHFLIAARLKRIKDELLSHYSELPDEIFVYCDQIASSGKNRWFNPRAALRMIERESPLLLHRDMAGIALMRLGEWSPQRADQVCGMMVYDLEEAEAGLALEACFALTHWRHWHKSVSKWFEFERLFEILDVALENANYEIWAAYSFVWALAKSGGELSLENEDYEGLLGHFGNLLEEGTKKDLEPDLKIACAIALGKLDDWNDGETTMQIVSRLYQNPQR